MKKSLVLWMLFWFSYTSLDDEAVARFLNRLPRGTEFRLVANAVGYHTRYTVFYNADKEVP